MNYAFFTLFLFFLLLFGWFWFSTSAAFLFFRAWYDPAVPASDKANSDGTAIEYPGETVYLDKRKKKAGSALYRTPNLPASEPAVSGSAMCGIVVLADCPRQSEIHSILLADGWAVVQVDSRSSRIPAWITWCRKRVPSVPVVVYGCGVGANRVVFSLYRSLTSHGYSGTAFPDGVIADAPSPYGDGSYNDAVQRMLGGRIISAGILWFSKLFDAATYGVSDFGRRIKGEAVLADCLSRIPSPVLLFERRRKDGSENEAKNTQIKEFLRRLS